MEILMLKYMTLFTLFFIQTANAAFIFGEGDDLTPSRYNSFYHPQLDVAHLLTKEELEKGLIKDFKTKDNIVVTHIPQTCWDLYVLMNYWKKAYTINGATYCESNDLNNGFIRFIKNDTVLLEHFKQGQFFDISRFLIRDIRSHLMRYDTEVEPLVEREGKRVRRSDFTELKMWTTSETYFPEIEDLLVKATFLEQECYDKDEIPFWRHSHTNLTIKASEGLESTIIDLPLFQRVNHTARKLELGTLCYGFSLLADFISDGTMSSICDYGQGSACTFSYFLQDLRDKVYAEGRLPFHDMSQNNLKPEEAAKRRKTNRTLTLTRLPKTIFNPLTEQGFSNDSTWFIPKINGSSWIKEKGEVSHPRHKGTHLNRLEEDRKHLFLMPGKFESDEEFLAMVRSFIKETSHLEVLAMGGNLLVGETLAEGQKLVDERNRFSEEILGSLQAPEILKKALPKTTYGKKFFYGC